MRRRDLKSLAKLAAENVADYAALRRASRSVPASLVLNDIKYFDPLAVRRLLVAARADEKAPAAMAGGARP